MTADLYTLPDLPYDYGALEPHISGRIMELHHDKHHAAYVKGANTALERLHDIREKGDFSAISMLEKNLAFNVSGHVLHSVFWTNLSPRRRRRASRRARRALRCDLRRVPRLPSTDDRSREHDPGRRMGARVLGTARPHASSSSRCTTTRATTARERSRSSPSTPGSTRTTCSTRTGRPTSSPPSGTSSTGTTSRCASAAARRP